MMKTLFAGASALALGVAFTASAMAADEIGRAHV